MKKIMLATVAIIIVLFAVFGNAKSLLFIDTDVLRIPIFSINNQSIGIFSIGTFSIGIFSIGLFSVGLFSISLFNIALYGIGVFVLAKKKKQLISIKALASKYFTVCLILAATIFLSNTKIQAQNSSVVGGFGGYSHSISFGTNSCISEGGFGVVVLKNKYYFGAAGYDFNTSLNTFETFSVLLGKSFELAPTHSIYFIASPLSVKKYAINSEIYTRDYSYLIQCKYSKKLFNLFCLETGIQYNGISDLTQNQKFQYIVGFRMGGGVF